MKSVFLDTSASPMSSLTSKALLNKLRNHRTTNKDGFTLIELLVVVIIIGILSSVALPAFLNQAAKAKIASAKSLVSSGAKECQAFLVEATGAAFVLTTEGSDGITFPGTTAATNTTPAEGDCTLALGGAFKAVITGGPTFKTTVSKMGGIDKSCTTTTSGAADQVVEGCTLSADGTAGSW